MSTNKPELQNDLRLGRHDGPEPGLLGHRQHGGVGRRVGIEPDDSFGFAEITGIRDNLKLRMRRCQTLRPPTALRRPPPQ
jgi:hypothetical protein